MLKGHTHLPSNELLFHVPSNGLLFYPQVTSLVKLLEHLSLDHKVFQICNILLPPAGCHRHTYWFAFVKYTIYHFLISTSSGIQYLGT
jgi:hypothetical protein